MQRDFVFCKRNRNYLRWKIAVFLDFFYTTSFFMIVLWVLRHVWCACLKRFYLVFYLCQGLITVLCFYIAHYFYKQMQIAYDNGYLLLKKLLIGNLNQFSDKNHFIFYKNLKILLIISFFFITSFKLIFVNYFNLIN